MESLFGIGVFSKSADWIDAVGFLAAGFSIATYSMKTMIPLRVAAICASALFLAYGVLAPSYPQIVLNLVLLPLNALRLHQMINLIEQVKLSPDMAMSMDWLGAYSARRKYAEGDRVFSKGDAADTMFYTVDGRFLLEEIGVELGPGQIVGEIGIVAPDNQRTQTFVCIEEGELLTISYDRVKELYFQNPSFGFYFLNLIAGRLIANNAELEKRLGETPALDTRELDREPYRETTDQMTV